MKALSNPAIHVQVIGKVHYEFWIWPVLQDMYICMHMWCAGSAELASSTSSLRQSRRLKFGSGTFIPHYMQSILDLVSLQPYSVSSSTIVLEPSAFQKLQICS